MYTHMQWNISNDKEWNCSTCNNMDGPRGYYAMWNKTKTNNVWFHLYVNSKKTNKQQQQQKAGIIDTENKKGLPEGKRKEIGEGGRKERGEGDLKVQTSSCKINAKEIKCSALTV